MSRYAAATLATMPALAWSALADGVARARHPFHLLTLATTGPDGPGARTVVLRGADAPSRTLSCHTDLRSAKIADLRADPRCAWLCYDRAGKLQLRLTATARIHAGDTLATGRWTAGARDSRQCYRPLAPGTPCDAAALDVPAAAEADGFAHFAVITARVESFEWLYLRAEGHRRARFEWGDDGWRGCWIGA